MSEAAEIAAVLKEIGRPMTLRRFPNPDGTGEPSDVTVYGCELDAAPQLGPGNVAQAANTLIISNAEIAAKPWPGPAADVPRGGDKIIDGTVMVTIDRAGVDTKRLGTEILAHFCRIKS